MTCPTCNGTGRLRELTGESTHDYLLPCMRCQRYCAGCGEWVSKEGHTCEPPDGLDGRDDRDERTSYEIGAERCPPRE